MPLDHDDISKIVEETVDKVLERLGIDTSNPITCRGISLMYGPGAKVRKRSSAKASSIVGVIVTGIASPMAWNTESLHLQ